MWHWTFVVLGESQSEYDRHINRHSGQKYVMVRGSEKLSGVFGIEDVEISRHNFVLAGTFPKSCLDFNQKRFDTAFRREGKDSA